MYSQPATQPPAQYTYGAGMLPQQQQFAMAGANPSSSAYPSYGAAPQGPQSYGMPNNMMYGSHMARKN